MNELNNYRILLVDDDPDLREVVSEELKMHGAIVQTADSGTAALCMVETNNYDIVVSDMRMPRGDGRFLAKHIAALSLRKKPLVFVYTGWSDLDAKEAQELQISAVFNKPLSIQHILDVILTQLARIADAEH